MLSRRRATALGRASHLGLRPGSGSASPSPGRGGLEFVAWGAVPGRSQELASALGGKARCLFPPGAPRPPVLARWLVSSVVTVAHVLRRRPSVLIVTNPPCPAAMVGWAVGRAVGARVVVDSHPGAFGAQGDRVAAVLQPLHRWVTRRADLSIVASERWRSLVESWGAEAVVVHEAPGDWRLTTPLRHRRLRVLFVGRFARDEPWHAVLEAADRVREVDLHITGDPHRAGIDIAALPPNVRLVGYLDAEGYRHAVEDADAVLTLTTEPGSVMRAGYEAVWAGRPLVVSDWPGLGEVFPYAIRVDNDVVGVAAGLRRLAGTYDRLASDAPAARKLQESRWCAQRDDLVARLGSQS